MICVKLRKKKIKEILKNIELGLKKCPFNEIINLKLVSPTTKKPLGTLNKKIATGCHFGSSAFGPDQIDHTLCLRQHLER